MATEKKISVASWCLPKKVNFGPCLFSVLCQKQSSSAISHSKNEFHTTKVLKAQFSKMTAAGDIDVPESSSSTPTTVRKF